MRTLVVGAAIVDLMMKVERLPKSGEDIPCKETKTVVGGCAYNVANTLRNLKCEHDLCVPVGSGSFADIIRRGMKEKGYECIGITIKTFNETGDGIKRENTCCSLDDVSDARSVACTLGIRHFLYNFTGQFEEHVMKRFVDAYENGCTPNPCIDCNRYIKFQELYERAKLMGYDIVVTGHYARVEYNLSLIHISEPTRH